MIDNLDFGARDEYPSRWNYNYASSMYLDDRKDRAYTEDTRNDQMDGCDPCNGYGSTYYDKCRIQEGDKCLSRTYPQCQRGYPNCPQVMENDDYPQSPTSNPGLLEKASFNFSNKLKEAFSEFNSSDQRIILITIIIICVVMIIINITKKKKPNKQSLRYRMRPQPIFIPGYGRF